MTPTFITALSDHLWQSTAVVAGVGLLTLLLRRNSAQVRYVLWLAASVKFLVPFAWLEALGQRFQAATAPPVVQRDLVRDYHLSAETRSRDRLVIRTADSGAAGMRPCTCWAFAALSRTSRMRRSATRLR